MSAWTSFWFWLTMLSIVGFIAVFVTIQVVTNYNPPLWIWYLYGISMAFLVVGFILYCYESAQHWRVRGEYQSYLEASGMVLQPVMQEAPACPLPQKILVQPQPQQYIAACAPPPPQAVCTRQVKVAPPPKKLPPPPVYVQEMPPAPPPKPAPKPCPLAPIPPTEPAFGAANLSSPTTRSPFSQG
jgi:hypothetical protein